MGAMHGNGLVQQLIRRRRRVRSLGLVWALVGCSSLLLSVAVVFSWAGELRTSSAGNCWKKRMLLFVSAAGFFSGPAYRCPIPFVNDAYLVGFEGLTRNTPSVAFNLSYIVEETLLNADKVLPRGIVFGGNPSWQQRDESFELNASMKIHCGFCQADGPEVFSPTDQLFGRRCRLLVATAIFDNYDQPHQPSNLSLLDQDVFCFVMVADNISLEAFKRGGLLSQDESGGKWIGIWRVLELKSLPYDEARRNGKVPKLLLHRLFPEVQYSVWIDGKLELVTDPILILERYLWRENQSFAIAQHKRHRSVYEEADACKRRKRYARPLIDKHMEVYRNEGQQPWSKAKLPLPSDVPEGALIVREHTPMTNLFSCLWFNEVNRFTPRDQLSFGYVVHRLHSRVPIFTFPNFEYNSLVVLHKHVRVHSSKLVWVKRMDELPQHLAGSEQYY